MIKRNKFFFSIVFTLIIISLLIPNVSAFFTNSHEYWTIKGFHEINSPITELCQNDLSIVLDGNTGADIAVLHYYDDQFMSYIGTHTRFSGYQTCLSNAGTDPQLQCFCYGVGLHNIQDHYAHTKGGLVPKYIKSSFSSNLIAHMTIERSYEIKHMEAKSLDPIISSGELKYYDDRVLDNLFVETGGSYKYLQLLKDMSGIDMRNDANIFANGYKGSGFYNTVYNEKLSLPWWFWSISIGLMIVGLGGGILFALYGKNNWKYLLILIYLLMFILGALIIFSFYSGNTWGWIKVAIMIVPIRVSDADVMKYDTIVQQATNTFLETGVLPFDDNSGLSYVDRNGLAVEGELILAEQKFLYII